jgi:non-specific serine/threonine protein kinase
VNNTTEYKRISLQVEKGLAFLQPLTDAFYNDLLEFSDNSLLNWMTRTGNRFIRNHSGSWAHVSVRELQNLRKHYIELLHKLWPQLTANGNLFILRVGKFNNVQQTSVTLATSAPEFKFKVDRDGDLIVIDLIVLLDGKVCEPNLRGGILLEKDGVLYLPKDASALSVLDLFKNGPLTFPLSVKKEVV